MSGVVQLFDKEHIQGVLGEDLSVNEAVFEMLTTTCFGARIEQDCCCTGHDEPPLSYRFSTLHAML